MAVFLSLKNQMMTMSNVCMSHRRFFFSSSEYALVYVQGLFNM